MIETNSHQHGTQSSSQSKSGEQNSIDQTKRAEAEITAREIRDDVCLRAHPQADKEGRQQRKAAACTRPKQRNADGDPSEKKHRHIWAEEAIEEESGEYPADQESDSQQRAGESCAFNADPAIGKHRHQMDDAGMDTGAHQKKRTRHEPKRGFRSSDTPTHTLFVFPFFRSRFEIQNAVGVQTHFLWGIFEESSNNWYGDCQDDAPDDCVGIAPSEDDDQALRDGRQEDRANGKSQHHQAECQAAPLVKPTRDYDAVWDGCRADADQSDQDEKSVQVREARRRIFEGYEDQGKKHGRWDDDFVGAVTINQSSDQRGTEALHEIGECKGERNAGTTRMELLRQRFD